MAEGLPSQDVVAGREKGSFRGAGGERWRGKQVETVRTDNTFKKLACKERRVSQELEEMEGLEKISFVITIIVTIIITIIIIINGRGLCTLKC